jgi:hypothetical protein
MQENMEFISQGYQNYKELSLSFTIYFSRNIYYSKLKPCTDGIK